MSHISSFPGDHRRYKMFQKWVAILSDYIKDVDFSDMKNVKNLLVCSMHFTPDDYEVSVGKSQLKPFAVPTIFGDEKLRARVSSCSDK